ncbi:hypothetical protein LshimejAT787_0404530 [Lyophyllum shimeji]|uniref:F-box domain-containing protein n=1 Tax=Lyophyllum shimeji TaxID=47721 RepID=A0A9P3PJK8_LYOSH|nr:hypothetical protein LshimejAT787_0404530 [Lyophyllum shimeji]
MQAATLLQKYCNPFTCSLSSNTGTPQMRPPPLPDELLLEIFEFATHVHRHATLAPLDPFTPRRVSNNVMGPNTASLSTRTKLSLVLVCRSWRRLAVQLLYDYLVIRSPARATTILAVLQRSSSMTDGKSGPAGYGQWTRHIEVHTHARGANNLSFLQTIFRIFQECPNVRMLSGIWNHPLPIEFLNAVAALYGPSLQGIYWNDRSVIYPERTTLASPEFLTSFSSLRVLNLRSYSGKSVSKSHAVTLPKVEDLVISNTQRSLAIATTLGLPALRNLTVKTGAECAPTEYFINFLHVHGASLVSVDLLSPSVDSDPEPDSSQIRRTACHTNPDLFLLDNRCPNLVTLTFPTTSSPLSPDICHPLHRIGLRGVRADSLYPDKATNTKGHLMSFTPDRYPKLEVVRTVGYLVEADTDSLIKDVFIWWVEKFEKQGVDFLDGEALVQLKLRRPGSVNQGVDVGSRLPEPSPS